MSLRRAIALDASLQAEAAEDLESAEQLQLLKDEVEMEMHTGATVEVLKLIRFSKLVLTATFDHGHRNYRIFDDIRLSLIED